jgi:protein-L-isoaspartate(D-aspartate) O-methyltransferase
MQTGAATAGSIVRMLAVLVLCGGIGVASAQDSSDPYAGQRRALMAELREQADAGPGSRAHIDREALELIARVPRHAYVPESQRRHAYQNRPLPIGHGQTISQPYIVALMTTLVRPGAGQKILEIGTGSGYQAAVLAESGARVYTIEIIEPLATRAAKVLREQGYDTINTRIADGYYGWEAHAPFDAIVVTAAASSVPPPLIAQLRPGGRMVIPVGGSFMTQTLMQVDKDPAGRVKTRQILPVRFVPLTGDH